MLITDNLVYLELHKTGCSHTRKVLSNIFEEKCKIIGKHNTYDSVPELSYSEFQGLIKLGNVRNPWDWYVSLWSFGCQHKGRLYSKLTKPSKKSNSIKSSIKNTLKKVLGLKFNQLDKNLWLELYSDSNNYENFNTWLILILSKKKHAIGEEYKESKVSNFIGLFTYRYLLLYTDRRNLLKVKNYQELKEYDSQENFMDVIIKNESLHSDLLGAAEKIGWSSSKVEEVLAANSIRTNASIREKDYRKYYTAKSKALVEEKDRLIIEKYHYKFD